MYWQITLFSKTGSMSFRAKEKPSYHERWRVIPWPELRRTPPQGRNCHHTSRESLQSTAPAFSADRVRVAGQEKQRGTLRQGLWLLDPVGLDAILPARPCRFAPRNLQWPRLGCCLGKPTRRANNTSSPLFPFRKPSSSMLYQTGILYS